MRMTHRLSRRALLGAAALPLAAPRMVHAQAQARLLVIGGGFGGASAANFARRHYPWLEVTLVEPRTRFVTCPYGNLVIGGVRRIEDITHGYDGLRARGVRVVHDWAQGIDAAARRVRLAGGETLAYDRLILSPGIALRYGALEGYDEAAAEADAACLGAGRRGADPHAAPPAAGDAGWRRGRPRDPRQPLPLPARAL
jgi:NADPH-dependent 2,4-dienoyl-CoA reductase/sulfur reductase-like enzyme